MNNLQPAGRFPLTLRLTLLALAMLTATPFVARAASFTAMKNGQVWKTCHQARVLFYLINIAPYLSAFPYSMLVLNDAGKKDIFQ